MELLEENIGDNISEIGLGKDFFDINKHNL